MAKNSQSRKSASTVKKSKKTAVKKVPRKKKAVATRSPIKKTVQNIGPASLKARAASERAAEARRKKSLKAIALYERALETLQKRKFSVAEPLFHKLITDFPDERELHERCYRYIEVCGREKISAPTPVTIEERLYAATLALNVGSEKKALEHLEAAVADEPDNDHVQYMLAVATAGTGEIDAAVTYLCRAIELNPDNKFLARHESGFESLHENELFQKVIETPSTND